MATVQLEFSDADLDLFANEARLEGMSLSEWLSWAVHARLEAKYGAKHGGAGFKKFKSQKELKEFFRRCDTIPGPEVEPDWEEHLRVINAARAKGAAPT